MKVLFIGDVVGNIGVKMINEYLPTLKKRFKTTNNYCKW